MNWLKYIHDDLAVPSGLETGDAAFEEILEFCLREIKKPDESIMAARVAVLALLWGAPINEGLVQEQILANLHANKHRGDHFTILLACVILLLASAETVQNKSLDILIKNYINPTLEAEADKITAKLSGEEVVESDVSDDDAPALNDYLIEFLESWQAAVGSLDDEALVSAHLKESTTTFLQLLHHDIEAIRIAAGHCLITVGDLADRFDVALEEEFSEASKTIARIAHDRDYEWHQEGTSRKAFEAIGEILAAKDYLVAVDLLPMSAGPTRDRTMGNNERRFFEANHNKKGFPIAGYADAAVLEFFNDHLGHNFADLFALRSPHTHRDNQRAFNTMRRAVTRHPGARSQSLHVDSVRHYGYSTGWRSRSFIDPSWEKKGRHRKVRVADYL